MKTWLGSELALNRSNKQLLEFDNRHVLVSELVFLHKLFVHTRLQATLHSVVIDGNELKIKKLLVNLIQGK